jgi:putative membrane protein
MMHSMGQDYGWILLGLTVWLAVVAAAVLVGVHLIRTSRPHPVRPPSPLDLLERRFAAGEITRDDFDEARARLREH